MCFQDALTRLVYYRHLFPWTPHTHLVLQITVCSSGRPVVGDLFATFDFEQLPDAVNTRTYDRLCAFLRDDLKREELVPPAMTVREVVEAIKKYNTSGTLCWIVAQETSGSGTGTGKQDGLGDFGSTQRVFAHCAKAVFAKVEVAMAAVVAATALVTPVAQVGSATGPGAPVDLAQWLASQDLHHLAVPLQKLGVYMLKDLSYAIEQGDVTAEALVEAGAESRIQARRLMRTTAAASL